MIGKPAGQILFVIAFMAAVASAAAAQDAARLTGLSLDECISIALKSQSDVLTGQNSVGTSKAGETQAKSSYYPQISAQRTGTIQRNTGRLGTPRDAGSLNLTQNFYDGGLREAKVNGARASVLQSETVLDRTRQSVIFNVTTDFYNLLQAQKLAEVQQTQVKYLTDQRDLTKSRFDLGAAAEVDLLPVEAQLANAQVSRLAAENSVRTAAIQLQSTMGLKSQMVFSVVETDLPVTDTNPLDNYIQTALANRPEIRQAEASLEIARSSVKSNRIQLYPRPAVDGQMNQSLISGGKTQMSIIGGFYFDIFDGGSNRAAYNSSKLSLSSTEIRAAQVQKDIVAQVQQAYLNLSNAKERLAASDVSVKAAQKNLDAQKERNRLGLAIPLDVLNAELQSMTAGSNAVQAKYDYYTSLSQLDYATGVIGGNNDKR